MNLPITCGTICPSAAGARTQQVDTADNQGQGLAPSLVLSRLRLSKEAVFLQVMCQTAKAPVPSDVHQLRFGGHVCSSRSSNCAPGELTKPSAFCKQFMAACHCAPPSPVHCLSMFSTFSSGESRMVSKLHLLEYGEGIKKSHQSVKN